MERYIKKYQKELRCGITTGTCATAAAAAAALHLLSGTPQNEITILTPKGERVQVPVYFQKGDENECQYMVIKDSGDDPDVTDGAQIHVQVIKCEKDMTDRKNMFYEDAYPGLFLDGAKGIGRVTRPGLEQEIGQAAINAVPRKMIFAMVDTIRKDAEYAGGLKIIVSIPEGEKLAERTFNGQLGIEGGLSVLGTSGIVEPMSEKAIVDTIEAQIRQLAQSGETRLLVTPGNYGQGYVSEYLGLDLSDSIKCSNYIGETIDLAICYGIKEFLLVGNIGKLVKLGAGIMNTHSKVADGRADIFMANAALEGATKEQLLILRDCITTEEILQYLEQWKLKETVMERICQRIQEYMERRIGGKMEFGVMIFSEKMGFLGQTKDTDSLRKKFE